MSMAWRRMGSGGALVNAWMCRSILETTRVAVCRLPSNMTMEVKRCKRGSSAGGMWMTGGCIDVAELDREVEAEEELAMKGVMAGRAVEVAVA